MQRNRDGSYRYRGARISRGAYYGTADDRADRWYIDDPAAPSIDRRGPGFPRLVDAREAIDYRRNAARVWSVD
jgi:hypothetical protein